MQCAGCDIQQHTCEIRENREGRGPAAVNKYFLFPVISLRDLGVHFLNLCLRETLKEADKLKTTHAKQVLASFRKVSHQVVLRKEGKL